MARKCSSCGNNGHNSRTCGGNGRVMMENGGGGVRLFGVQLHVGSSSPMKKCFSMECLSSAAPAAYYAAALAASSSSPSVSSSSSLVSVEETAEKVTNGYLSDGLMGRAQERKKGVPWTEDEHRRFLAGLEKLGKGDWRGISRHFVTTRTPTQVASHAQKYFLRQSSLTHKKRRSSLFDVVENADRAATSANERLRQRRGGGLGAGHGAPGSVSRHHQPAGEARAHPASEPFVPAATVLIGDEQQQREHVAERAAPRQKHPSSLTLSKPHHASLQQAAPDLELKISTTADYQAGSSPRTPFFGTIRVT
ncbi:hypothetical protein SEVIR_5G134200v4 [Setaria viridis]|uniref:Uncharacterized protein n=2 Tax=Setaria TaxID=4554 RepID=K3XKD0_SETIT|nr:transcription factor MYBS3 [Setaria italica]XP_034598228.1 transcription factor MYBS3-like [Setaria viridis]RCV25057.1 hypothetical protein SETIT_5G135900v2 [Setaria italica]TKW13944.1 hypothetical protein SEVIR_5G134200v2 [Setaria viridis]